MKVLCLVFILGAAAPFITASNVRRVARDALIPDSIHSDLLFNKIKPVYRIKRNAEISPELILGPTDPNFCALNCMDVLGEKLADQFPDYMNDSNGGIGQAVTSDYDQKRFEEFCDIYVPSSRCLDLCPDSKIRTIWKKTLATADYVCIDRYDDFKKYGACLNNASREVDQRCGDMCGHQNGTEILANLTGQMQADKDQSESAELDDDDITDVLNNSCSYINCVIDCDPKVVRDQCGPEAEDLEKDVLRVALDSTYDLMKSNSDDFDWPDSCDMVQNQIDQDDQNASQEGTTPEFEGTTPQFEGTTATFEGTSPGPEMNSNTEIVIPLNQTMQAIVVNGNSTGTNQ